MARFMRKGITRFYWVPTIASASLIPTTAEVTAGTRLDGQLAEVNGFSFENNPIQTPDMSTAFVSQIAGEDATEDSSLTFYEDLTSNPNSTVLAKGTNGYVVIVPRGTAGATPAAGDKSDVWPAQITSNAKQFTADNEAGKYMVKFAATSQPGFEKTLT
jgi:hypothetical protein